jgi:hypothetical protein
MPHSPGTRVLLLGALAAGCGNASVTVAFDHVQGALAERSATAPAPGVTPAVFGLKIVAIYLAEDVDSVTMDNVGDVQRIWTNPVCDPDGTRCSIAPWSGPNQVKDYFDLALPSDVVNARLSSQGATVQPGSYRYLRFDMAGVLPPGEDNAVPNLRFGASAASASEVRFRGNNYTILLDPPLALGSGDSVTVTLAYDVTDSYYADPGLSTGRPPAGYDISEWYCAGVEHDPAGPPCLAFKGFVPSVGKVAAPVRDAGR